MRQLFQKGSLSLLLLAPCSAPAQRQMEYLDRGLVVVRTSGNTAFMSWRLLGTDPDGTAFNVYRTGDGLEPRKLNPLPLTKMACFADSEIAWDEAVTYSVRPVLADRELAAGRPFTLPAQAAVRPSISLPLQTPEGYRPNDVSVGDLDGDGQYEIILHQSARGRDNSQSGLTQPPVFQGYKLDGSLLWTINLGKIQNRMKFKKFKIAWIIIKNALCSKSHENSKSHG